jgi:membrane protein implicated in regulation of membrane protease activity
MLRIVLTVLGAAALLMGLLWIGQGLGLVRWPASSFMIDRSPWAVRGVGLAIVGIVLLLVGRRRTRIEDGPPRT